MPAKPKVPCKHPGCPALVPSGSKYCEAHKALHPEEVRSAARRGYGSAWQKASRQFLRDVQPLVDHIIPHRGDEKLFWDQENWQGLCKRCHDQKTRREDQTPLYHY